MRHKGIVRDRLSDNYWETRYYTSYYTAYKAAERLAKSHLTSERQSWQVVTYKPSPFGWVEVTQ
jgi:hypothetical protein